MLHIIRQYFPPKREAVCLAVAAVLTMASDSGAYALVVTTLQTFDGLSVDEAPTGFTLGVTGGGGAASWIVRKDAGAPSGNRILAQESRDRVDLRFPVCLLDGVEASDVDVAVKFKAVAGDIDRAAGLVIRARDFNNYYVVRANALENNVRFYRVVGGRRHEIAGADVAVSSAAWHRLRLTASGRRFEVYFNDVKLFTADDPTFPQAGRVGLWTKADSVTYFDDFMVNLERQ